MQMESGNLCIFLNLNDIQQYFYDMLNQNYQEIGSLRFCNVAIGPDKSRCIVNDKFRCVLIVDHKTVHSLDPPLLNRFEKQLFTEDFSLDSNMKITIQKLNNWIESLQVAPFSKKLMFPTLMFDENQSLQQLVILYKDLLKGDLTLDRMEMECKRAIIRVATF